MEKNWRYQKESQGDHASQTAYIRLIEVERAASLRKGIGRENAARKKSKYEEQYEGNNSAKQGITTEKVTRRGWKS